MEETSSTSLKEVVRSTIEQIKQGLPRGCRLQGTVDFDLAVVNLADASDEVDLRVVQFGGNVSQQEVQRITFRVAEA